MARDDEDDDIDLMPDDDFRAMVDRELRSGHPSVRDAEQQEIDEIGMRLRDRAAIHRWISALESMKSSSETQLGAKRADVKKIHGKVSDDAYKEQLRQFHAWRAGNLRFLNMLRTRLIEARELRRRYFEPDQGDRLARAIEDHRKRVLAEDWEPNDADKELWETID